MKINPGHADERKHDGLCSDETADLQINRLIRIWIGKRIEIIDIHLVRAICTIRVVFVGDQTAVFEGFVDQRVDFLV